MDKNKIGILTFHCAENYGAFLQVYATQSFLKKYITDKNVEVIDYRPNYIVDGYKFNIFEWFCKESNLIYNIKSFISYMFIVPNRIIRKINFKNVNKLLNLSSISYTKTSDFSEDNTAYDYIVLGSDQIWNPMITKGIDPVFFGNIPNKFICKKIGYAVSTGVSSYSENEKDSIRKFIKEMSSISLRESSTINLLNEIYESNYTNVLDPTFLLENEFWNKFSKKIKFSKYILVYSLENNSEIMEDAYKFAKENNLKIVTFSEPGIKNYYKDIKLYSISYVGPKEFVGAIKNAEIILTNSYHATCFSIIFNKIFYTYGHSKTSSRMIDLSNLLDFKERIISYGECCRNYNLKNEKINYRNINKKIEEQRSVSIKYMLSNLE